MPKIRYSDQQLKNEMLRVYKDSGDKVPIGNDWNKLSKINYSTISRRFGSWSNAWGGIGLSIKNQTIRSAKRKLICDFIEAYNKHKNITSNYELLKLSGHRKEVIQKYFVSMDGFINATKLDARQRVFKEDILNDYIKIHNIVKCIPTKKDIRKYGKYGLFLYLKNYGDLDSLAKAAKIDTKNDAINISKDELIDDLKEIGAKINKTPTIQDIYIHGKFSVSTYTRYFKNFEVAIVGAGFAINKNKQRVECQDCKQMVVHLARHVKNKHRVLFKKNEKKILELYRSGLSNRKIAVHRDVIFNSASAVSRIVSNNTTPSERARLRLEKIRNTTNYNYKLGRMDRVKSINKIKNTDEKTNAKISSTLKKSYRTGEKTSWNKGQTKKTNNTILDAAKKTSNTIKSLYSSGQILRSNSASTKRYRLGAGFTLYDRRNIKKRANHMCEVCGITQEKLEESGRFLECDHILPIYKGGVDNWSDNGQALCPECHLLKTQQKSLNLNYENVISNDIGCAANDILFYNGQKLTKKFISTLEYRDRYILALYLLDFFSKYNFNRPLYSKTVLEDTMVYLNNNKCIYEESDYGILLDNKNSVGIKICRHFFPNILDVKNKNNISTKEALNDREILLKIIMNRLGGMLNDNFDECFDVTPALMIRGARTSFVASRGSIFKPTVAKAIYKYWVKDGDIVYDYSAGFGGRMLGLHSTGIKAKYICSEPNIETYNGLVKMADKLGVNTDINMVCSEEFVPTDTVDFAFSSPPYFNHEIYSAEQTQCYNRFPIYNDWLEGYWRKTVQNIRTCLSTDGVFGLNVGNKGNKKMKTINEDMTNIILEEGFVLIDTWYMKTINPHFNSSGLSKLEPIYFYKKNLKGGNKMENRGRKKKMNISTNLDCKVSEVLVFNGETLTPKYIRSLSIAKRKKMVKSLVEFFIKYDFTKIKYESKRLQSDWKSVKNNNLNIEKNQGLKIISNRSSTGMRVCRSFFPNVLKISGNNARSIYECLTDRKTLEKIIRNRLGIDAFGDGKTDNSKAELFNITPAMMIQGARSSRLATTGSFFKPSTAKTIYKEFVKDGDIVYDYSAGFGGRLLGLISSGIKAKYVAVEPNSETYAGLKKLGNHFKADFDIFKTGSENFIYTERVDFVFSSPPYFDYEVYSKECTQSCVKFPNYDDWLESYWRETVKNIKIMLKSGGIFGINAGNDANKVMSKLKDDLNNIIKEEGFVLYDTWHMKTSRSHLSGKRKTNVLSKLEPIYFYKKP